MWVALASSLQVLASAVAQDASKVAQEGASDASVPPDTIPGFDGKLPTPEQFLDMLDTMTGISDEEKAALREDLLNSIRTQSGYSANPAAANDLTMQTIILFSLVGLVALIFVFFVYKLFKCLTERETKREEKKKNKQLKKKK